MHGDAVRSLSFYQLQQNGVRGTQSYSLLTWQTLFVHELSQGVGDAHTQTCLTF